MPATASAHSYQPDLFHPDTLTSGALPTCAPPTSPGAFSVTSSLASVDGPKRCASPECSQTSPCGLALVHASHSPQPDNDGAPQTNGTCGQSSATSSRSAALPQSLESRLRVLTEGRGSTLYGLKWKHWDMPSGPPICALRASVRRILDNDFISSGWPTPCANNSTGAGTSGREGGLNLQSAAALAGWPTPTATDANRGRGTIRPHDTGIPLPQRASMTTPMRRTASGLLLTGSGAGMESGGLLSPEHSRWIMGYPAGWHTCGDTATPSSRKSPQPSSAPPSPQNELVTPSADAQQLHPAPAPAIPTDDDMDEPLGKACGINNPDCESCQ